MVMENCNYMWRFLRLAQTQCLFVLQHLTTLQALLGMALDIPEYHEWPGNPLLHSERPNPFTLRF